MARIVSPSTHTLSAMQTARVDKMSISMDPELGEQARLAAARSGEPLSKWISDAVAARLRVESLRELLAEYEQEAGEFTTDELDAGGVAVERHAAYGVVSDGGDRLNIELRRVGVETAALEASVRRSGMPHAEWWLGLRDLG